MTHTHTRGQVCYINYAAAPDSWALGNGSMPPPKKEFLDPEYNHTMRRFRGVVDWTPTYDIYTFTYIHTYIHTYGRRI
jgi:hypothetical protein